MRKTENNKNCPRVRGLKSIKISRKYISINFKKFGNFDSFDLFDLIYSQIIHFIDTNFFFIPWIVFISSFSKKRFFLEIGPFQLKPSPYSHSIAQILKFSSNSKKIVINPPPIIPLNRTGNNHKNFEIFAPYFYNLFVLRLPQFKFNSTILTDSRWITITI